jgi:acetyl esterase
MCACRGAGPYELATPLHAPDLSSMTRTLVVIAEEDLLRDEAAEYAQRLAEAGVAAQVRRYAGQQHGFVGLKPTGAYRQVIGDIAGWLKADHTAE